MANFRDLGIEPSLAAHLETKLGIAEPTKIQKQLLEKALRADKQLDDTKDFLIQAQTGSGKTLAFLLPLLNTLNQHYSSIKQSFGNETRQLGTVAIILSPTRELAKQIYDVLEDLLKAKDFPHWIVPGILTGGEKKKSEKARLRKGSHILIATPGRLLDHLQNTQSFKTEILKFIILDEADRLLDLGFEKKVVEIMNILEKKSNPSFGEDLEFSKRRRQIILCSATMNEKVVGMVGKSMVNPIKIAEESKKTDEITVPSSLEQNCVVVEAKYKFLYLVALLNELNKVKGKVIVFFSCCDVVDYYFLVLCNLKTEADSEKKQQSYDPDNNLEKKEKIDISASSGNSCLINGQRIFRLHGSRPQEERAKSFREFSNSKSGILLCTDVAARGLDLPDVDSIVQYDPPSDYKDYIHRIGRTARIGRDGRAYLFLLPSETGYNEFLEKFGLSIVNIEASNLLKNLQITKEPLRAMKNWMHLFQEFVLSDVTVYFTFIFSYND